MGVMEGTMTGLAKYLATGRPPANQHQTWKDMYILYWKSHYNPAMNLAFAYLIYTVLAMQNRSEGKLPMVLVLISVSAWMVAPIVFSPFQRWGLIGQDVQDFNNFIVGCAGTTAADIPDVINRGGKLTFRSLFECGLAHELSIWSERPGFTLVCGLLGQLVGAVFLAFAIPSEILDYLPVCLLLLSATWALIFGYFMTGLNNVFYVLSFLIWLLAPRMAQTMIGSRFNNPTFLIRMPEFIISFAVFLYVLHTVKTAVLVVCRASLVGSRCGSSQEAQMRRLHQCTRVCFLYFGVHQLHVVKAYIIMLCNLVTAALLASIDRLCRFHSWFLLNSELGRTKHGERYLEEKGPFYELDGHDDLSLDSESDPETGMHDCNDGSC